MLNRYEPMRRSSIPKPERKRDDAALLEAIDADLDYIESGPRPGWALPAVEVVTGHVADDVAWWRETITRPFTEGV